MVAEFRARMVGRVAILSQSIRWHWRSYRYRRGRLWVSVAHMNGPLQTWVQAVWEVPWDRPPLPEGMWPEIRDWLSQRDIPMRIIDRSLWADLSPDERFEFKMRWL